MGYSPQGCKGSDTTERLNTLSQPDAEVVGNSVTAVPPLSQAETPGCRNWAGALEKERGRQRPGRLRFRAQGPPRLARSETGDPQSRLGGSVAHGPRDSAQPSRALASGCRSVSCGPVRSRCRWGRPGRQHVCRGLCYHCILQAITERTFPSTGPCEKELTWVLNSGNP